MALVAMKRWVSQWCVSPLISVRREKVLIHSG